MKKTEIILPTNEVISPTEYFFQNYFMAFIIVAFFFCLLWMWIAENLFLNHPEPTKDNCIQYITDHLH